MKNIKISIMKQSVKILKMLYFLDLYVLKYIRLMIHKIKVEIISDMIRIGFLYNITRQETKKHCLTINIIG